MMILAGTKEGLTDGMIASFGSLIFGGLMLERTYVVIKNRKA